MDDVDQQSLQRAERRVCAERDHCRQHQTDSPASPSPPHRRRWPSGISTIRRRAHPFGLGLRWHGAEISNPTVNGGAFLDILAAGGSFVIGGYNRTINAGEGSPIAGRQAWSGLSAGTTAAPTYIMTTVTLPEKANGQLIKLKWRVATDTSAIAAGQAGVRIDHISIAALQCLRHRARRADRRDRDAGNQKATVSFAPRIQRRIDDTGYTVLGNPAGGWTPTRARRASAMLSPG